MRHYDSSYRIFLTVSLIIIAVAIVTIVFYDIIIQLYHHGTETVMIRSAISYSVYIMLCIINCMIKIYTQNIVSYTLLNCYTVAVYYTLYSFIIREMCRCLLLTKKGDYIFNMHMVNIFSIILITRLFYLTKFCYEIKQVLFFSS